MNEAEDESLHPGPVELTQYARGRLERGHAVAILAHAAACARCGRILADMVAARASALTTPFAADLQLYRARDDSLA